MQVSRCRFWWCAKCKAVFEKEDLELKILAYSGSVSVMGSRECGNCHAVYLVGDIYAGKHDVPRQYWSQLAQPVELPESAASPAASKPAPSAAALKQASLPAVWGIEIGHSALKALRAVVADGHITAAAVDYVEYPTLLGQPGNDPLDIVVQALTTLQSRSPLRGEPVAVSIPTSTALASELKVSLMEKTKSPDGKVSTRLAKDYLQPFLTLLGANQVNLSIVQHAPLALCNYLAYDLVTPSLGGGAIVIAPGNCVGALDVGAENTRLIITDGRKIAWQQSLTLAGNRFTQAIAEEFKLPFSEAESLKRNAVRSPQIKQIVTSLKPVLTEMVSELQGARKAFASAFPDAPVQCLVGLGNAFKLPGMRPYLQEKLQIPIHQLEKPQRLECNHINTSPIYSGNVASFPVPIGLALQALGSGKVATNLLPPDYKPATNKKSWSLWK